VAEGFRNQGQDALVVVDDLSPLSVFWDQTTVALLGLYGRDRADMGGDSEMRGFYSSLLQRNAQLTSKSGGGSMSTLVLMDDQALKSTKRGQEGTAEGGEGGEEKDNNKSEVAAAAAAAADTTEEAVYTLADFEGAFYANKTRSRLSLLASRGVVLTGQVLDKLGIPAPSVDAAGAMLATMHVDQLISLADGHIVLNPKLREGGLVPPLDPSHSLTRIGVGTESRRTIASSVHSAAIKKVNEFFCVFPYCLLLFFRHPCTEKSY
jgi:hypothetical protein